jgi:hypothetical protein
VTVGALPAPSARPWVAVVGDAEPDVLGDGVTCETDGFRAGAGADALGAGECEAGECVAGEADVLGASSVFALAGDGCEGRGAEGGAELCDRASFEPCALTPGRGGSASNPPKTPSPSAISQAASSAAPVAVPTRTRR